MQSQLLSYITQSGYSARVHGDGVVAARHRVEASHNKVTTHQMRRRAMCLEPLSQNNFCLLARFEARTNTQTCDHPERRRRCQRHRTCTVHGRTDLWRVHNIIVYNKASPSVFQPKPSSAAFSRRWVASIRHTGTIVLYL